MLETLANVNRIYRANRRQHANFGLFAHFFLVLGLRLHARGREKTRQSMNHRRFLDVFVAAHPPD
jgi:hypothetical protein